MRPVIEVHDLKQIDYKFLKQRLYPLSFQSAGWMVPNCEQILRGYDTERPSYKLSYNRANVLIAYNDDHDDDTILGWAMVRHPSRRVVVKSSGEWLLNKWSYGGRRPDISVYVAKKYRRQGVARQLLLVGFNNFGRLNSFPHNDGSHNFYYKNRQFCVRWDTNKFSSAQFTAFEVAELP